MVVKEFIPIEDAKITVEKEVKPKQSVAELTTIEKPGKPVSADNFDSSIKKSKRRISKKSVREPSKIVKVKKDGILIITEKPQSAQKIAQAIGNPKKFTEGKVSYYELERNGKKIRVASAVGHLFNLSYVKGQRGWPIFNLEWVPSFRNKNAAFTKSYYDVLKKLAERSSEFIVATDYDIEGEVIGWNVLRFICKKETAKRMKYSTLTKDELVKSFDNPMLELDWGHAYAGETRHFLDWLYGINLSRALMSAIKTTGSFRILSIGRVQGPALKIIIDREREINEFKPEPYWQVFALKDGINYKHPKDIFDKSELDKFKDVKEVIAQTKEKDEIISPPVPFDLTSLQREAYGHYRISPSQTLQIAQQLYLDGLISYPRTSSQKIPDSIEPKKIIKALEKNFNNLTKNVSRVKPIEGNKSDPAHPSIYPTGEFKNLISEQKKLYELIVRRFLSAFSANALTSNKRIVLKDVNNPELNFSASGLKIKEKGWMNVYPSRIEEIDLKDLNGRIKIDEIKIEEKETQPPKRFTPTSLITILEKKNLGTKATRSTIVDTLFDRGYLEGKSIKATPLGMRLITALEKYSPIIIDENLTRKFEEEMEQIQSSKEKNLLEKEKEILRKSEKILIDISKEFKVKEINIGKELLEGLEELRKEEQESNTIIECPKCKKGKLRILFSRKTKRQFVACSAYPECRNTYTLPPNSLVRKTDKVCEECGWPKLMSLKKGKRPWEFCFNTDCPIVKKRLEEYRNRIEDSKN